MAERCVVMRKEVVVDGNGVSVCVVKEVGRLNSCMKIQGGVWAEGGSGPLRRRR